MRKQRSWYSLLFAGLLVLVSVQAGSAATYLSVYYPSQVGTLYGPYTGTTYLTLTIGPNTGMINYGAFVVETVAHMQGTGWISPDLGLNANTDIVEESYDGASGALRNHSRLLRYLDATSGQPYGIGRRITYTINNYNTQDEYYVHVRRIAD